jgi:eukaryotic-like serine/threonine-protein kinase
MTTRARRRIAPGRRLFGRYRIERQIGRGGSAEVWLAHDDRLDRTVAIKAPLPEALPDAAARDRFVAEARAAASLSHPAIVPVYDVVRDPATPAMVLRYVDGDTLAARGAREGRLPPREVARIGAELAGALAHAHAAGLVHRDVKPGNVLLDADGRAQLVDFGIAASLIETADHGAPGTTDAPGVREVTGTLRYMAPEQLRGRPADARSDLYALGLVLYELLAGHPAFDVRTPEALLEAQVGGPPSLPRVVPAALRALVSRLLATDPEARPASAGEVEAALHAEAARLDALGPSPRGDPMPPTVTPGLPAAVAGFGLAPGVPPAVPRVLPPDPADPGDAGAEGAASPTFDASEPGVGDTIAFPLPVTAAITPVPPPSASARSGALESASMPGLPVPPAGGGARTASPAPPRPLTRPAGHPPRAGRRTRPIALVLAAAGALVAALVLGGAINGFGNGPAVAESSLQAPTATATPSRRPTAAPTHRATSAPGPVAPGGHRAEPKHHKGKGHGH